MDKKEYATILGINNSLTSLNQIFAPMLGGAFLLVDLPEVLLGLCAISFSVILILLLIEKQKGKKAHILCGDSELIHRLCTL